MESCANTTLETAKWHCPVPFGRNKQFMRSAENSRALTETTLKSGANVHWPYAESVSDLPYRGAATNVDSRLVTLETSQEIMITQYNRMSIMLTALQNSTLSTIRLQEPYTIGNECEFLCGVISFAFKVSDSFRCARYRGVQVGQRKKLASRNREPWRAGTS